MSRVCSDLVYGKIKMEARQKNRIINNDLGARQLIIEYIESCDSEITDEKIIQYMMNTKFASQGRDFFQGIINGIREKAISDYIIERKFAVTKQGVKEYVKQKYPAFNEKKIDRLIDEIIEQIINVQDEIIKQQLKEKAMIQVLKQQKKEGKYNRLSDDKMFEQLFRHIKGETEKEQDR